MRLMRLAPGPLSDELVADLQGQRVLLLEPDARFLEELRAAGIPAEVADTEMPDGAILLIRARPLDELAYVVDRLLGPGGCPWDQEQTHESLKKYLLEEAYETLDAIDSGSTSKLEEELGDLLLQPYMHAQMEKRDGEFDIDDVARGITAKLIRRHPHVFGDQSVADSAEVLRNWDQIKSREKGTEPQSILAGVPTGMASLLRAHEVSKRAARVGFEWPSIEAVFDKLHEEEEELREALAGGDPTQIESEVGDFLFTLVNVARWAKVEPEEALRRMLNRFTARFMHMERSAGTELGSLSPEKWDELWRAAKSEVG
jgi:tetrapyrrole methylase family protein/MazG family protein